MNRRDFIAGAAATAAGLALPIGAPTAPSDASLLEPIDESFCTSAVPGPWSSASSADIVADIKQPWPLLPPGSLLRYPRPIIYFGEG